MSSGDPVIARNTVYAHLEQLGFSVTRRDEWSAFAERGSAGKSIWLGAMAGEKGRHVMVEVQCASDHQGNLVISLQQGTSGWSGGIIGKNQADNIYQDVYSSIGGTLSSVGVLVSSQPL